MFNLGNGNKKAYLGDKALDKAHLGDTLVYSGGAAEAPFTSTYNIATDSETLTLPVTKNYEIDWGDGTTTTTGKSHVYANSGVYTVKMFGVVDDFVFNSSGDRLKILTVESWGGFNANSASNFSGCSNLVSVPNDLNPTSLTLFLRDCVSLVSGCENFDFQEMPINGPVNGCFRVSTSFNSPLNWTNTQNIGSWVRLLQSALSFNNDSLSNLDYSGATDIQGFMIGKSSLNFDFQYYDNLLIKWASGAANGGLDFTKLLFFTTDFGTIQYSSAGAAAHDSLTAQGLTISDGGLRQGAFTATYNIAADGETLTLPVNKDYEVDWGDGVTTTTENSHTYATLGVYTVKMEGLIDDWNNNNDIDSMVDIVNLGSLEVGELTFANANQLSNTFVSDFNITGDSASFLFGFSTFNPTIPININFDNVSDADCSVLFNSCINLNQDISITGVTNSINLRLTFRFLFVFNSNISLPNGIKVTNLNQCFNRGFVMTEDYLLLNNVDTSECEDFGSLYQSCTIFNKDVSWMDFRIAKSVSNFMSGKSAANYDYQYYDNLLIKWSSGAANGGLDFTKLTNLTTNFGTIQYSSAGAASHASLIAQGLIITDGGQNSF